MNFRDLEEAAIRLNGLYEQLELKRYGRVWSTEELRKRLRRGFADLRYAD